MQHANAKPNYMNANMTTWCSDKLCGTHDDFEKKSNFNARRMWSLTYMAHNMIQLNYMTWYKWAYMMSKKIKF